MIREDNDFSRYLKFSDRDTEAVSNRSLLANALESVAQNDIERQKMQEYKGKIDLILEENKLKAAIEATGYRVTAIQSGPYEKKGFPLFRK